VLADADECRGREDRITGELRPDGPEQSSGYCGERDAGEVSQVWPALSGQWPSRPGEPQHGWEPSRVVGDAASQRSSPCGAEPTGQQREASTSGAGEQTGQRQVIAPLGVLLDGLPSAMGGTWPEVHNRVAQLKAAGNAIVPEVAAIFMLAILRAAQKARIS